MKDCAFCNLRPEQIIYRNPQVFAIRDIYPLTEGHTLVIPRAHVVSVFDAAPTVRNHLWQAVADVRGNLAREYGTSDFTIAVNDGFGAGQTISHAHIHVIPRRPGDVPLDRVRGGIRWLFPDKAPYWEHP